MSWYDNERALTYSEVYPNETAASDDFARAEAHGWTIQERFGVQGDVTDAMQRLSHVRCTRWSPPQGPKPRCR